MRENTTQPDSAAEAMRALREVVRRAADELDAYRTASPLALDDDGGATAVMVGENLRAALALLPQEE